MSKDNFIDRQNQRLQHIEALLALDYKGAVYNLENDLGDPVGCLMSLASHAKVNAMLSWFKDRDIEAFRQWSYLSGKLRQKWYQVEIDTINPGLKNIELLDPLISNNQDLINWFTNLDSVYDMKRVEKVNTADFFAYQSIVALRGDWDRLLARCQDVIANPPSSLKKWQDYHYLYLALAQGDKTKMEDILQTMVAPHVTRSRCSEETGVTEGLIFSRIIIAMKIAWRHGYEVKVDSPYISMEWMPIEPLARYDNFYSFLT
jgi:hypothetical protein